MRLTELVIENYGGYVRRTLTIPEDAGLTIFYGPNEAGKSTCLEAISDFFFTIPKNTARGGLFGYDGMRLGASMRMASGDLLTLRRRKGNGKTLTDAAGTALDDATLAPILGAVTRDRFATLFGLDHESLRVGGDRLLLADGDIGRLIVEAGGGLRTLIERLDTMDAEAATLFAKTKSGSRAFYQGLAAYESADKFIRGNQLSRDTYEQSRKLAERSAKLAADLRDERRRIGAEIASLERVLRVVPHLRERELLLGELAAFADCDGYPADFSAKVRDALAAQAAAAKSLDEATGRRDRLAARITGLSVLKTLAASEKDVRALSEQALHIAKQRDDRPNRQRDLEQSEAQLAALRRMLKVGPDEDLADKLPEPAAIEQVRALAADAIERAPVLTAAERRLTELLDAAEAIDQRLASARQAGYHLTPDVAASHFASVAVQKAALDARQGNVAAAMSELIAELRSLGYADIQALAAALCPTADRVRAEQAAQDMIIAQQVEQQRFQRDAAADAISATREIEALQATGRVATQGAVVDARQTRATLWTPIRETFVDGRTDLGPDARLAAARAFEEQVDEADDLADRRAEEAQRAATLVEAERRAAHSRERLDAAELELAVLSRGAGERQTAFLAEYPLAAELPTLARLLDFSERRAQLLERAEALRRQTDEIAIDGAQLEPVLALLAQAERQLGLASGGALAARVQTVQAGLARHEAAHAAYLRDGRDREGLASQLKGATAERDRLQAEQAMWPSQWPAAVAALGLNTGLSPREADTITTEWVGARGILAGMGQMRQRLARMDEDEAALRRDVTALAMTLEIDVPADPVAAAKMLQQRWEANEAVRVQHASIAPDLEEAKVEVDIAARSLGTAEDVIAGLANETALAQAELAGRAERHDLRMACGTRLGQAERTAIEAGDQLSIADLIEQWAARDLDMLRAGLAEARVRSSEIDGELEAAILAEKEARDTLSAFASETRVGQAVVEREGATAQMHLALERYLELTLARDLVTTAMARIRSEQQDPLIARASALFAAMTRGEFTGIETDIDDKGQPIVVGRRRNGGSAAVSVLSDGTRDQLFLAFRLASLENYASATEPLPFIADDILVHFDDDRSQATLELLAEFAQQTQVLLFTHHRSLHKLAEPLAAAGLANIVCLDRLT